MNKLHVQILLFCIGVGLASTVIYVPFFDPITIPRLTITFLIVGICSLLILKKKSKVSISIYDLIFISFVMWACFGLFKSHDKAETIFAVLKFLIFFGLYKLSTYYFSQSINSFSKYISITFLTINTVSIILFIIALFALPHCPSFEDLYVIRGLHGHKNLVASYFVISIPYIILYGLQRQKIVKLVSIIVGVICFILIVFIDSRAAIISFVVMFLFALFIYRKYLFSSKTVIIKFSLLMFLAIILSFALKLYVFCGVLFPQHDTVVTKNITNYYYNQDAEKHAVITTSAYERMSLWKKTILIIKDNPFLGVGLENWKFEYPKYSLNGLIRCEIKNVNFLSPHNDYLWIASETGIVGFLLYFTFIFLLVWNAIKNSKLNNWIKNAALLSVIALTTNMLFDFPHQTIAHMIVFFISLGIIKSDIKYSYAIVNKYVIFLLVLFMFFCSFVLTYRILGEVNTSMLIKKKNTNSPQLVSYCIQAESFFYNSNALGMPIEWYRGNILAKKGDVTKAKLSFESALETAPYNRFVIQDLATASHILGDDKKASELYLKALQISPKFDDARLNYATILIQQNQFDSAIQVLKNIVDTTNIRYSEMNSFLLLKNNLN